MARRRGVGMSWKGPIKTIVDLEGRDSPGAQPFGVAGPGGGATLTFQPGGTAGPGQFTTFAPLYDAFHETTGLVFLGIDASFAPASSDVLTYDWQNRVIVVAVGDNFSDVFGSQITIPDGAQFRNLIGLQQNLQINTMGSSLPS